MKKGDLKYGDIVLVDFYPSVGHEYRGQRPAVVVESDKQISMSNTVTIIPMTSSLENRLLDDILVSKDSNNNLACDSLIKVFTITSFDYQRFIKKIGIVDSDIIKQLKKYLIKHFDLK
jgi:mRNA interferase MazF